ncbi:hypothetical protein GOP47_0014667, partial [Adiantum capillus-veneris]
MASTAYAGDREEPGRFAQLAWGRCSDEKPARLQHESNGCDHAKFGAVLSAYVADQGKRKKVAVLARSYLEIESLKPAKEETKLDEKMGLSASLKANHLIGIYGTPALGYKIEDVRPRGDIERFHSPAYSNLTQVNTTCMGMTRDKQNACRVENKCFAD